MLYILKGANDSFTVFDSRDKIHPSYVKDVVEFESLPTGDGILRLNNENKFYFEPIAEQPSIEPPVVTVYEPTPEQVQAQILMNTELLVMYKEFGL